eukprot:m.257388 g.257388  ORF g.257388 m.257388 type:complete len:170 (-) comp15958_c0_seq5:1092-1601(-)
MQYLRFAVAVAATSAVLCSAALPCTVTDPRTGQGYDLSSLKASTYYRATPSQDPNRITRQYLFNLCTPIVFNDVARPWLCQDGTTMACETFEYNNNLMANESFGYEGNEANAQPYFTVARGTMPPGVPATGFVFSSTCPHCLAVVCLCGAPLCCMALVWSCIVDDVNYS